MSWGKRSCSKCRTEASGFPPKNCRLSERISFAAASRKPGGTGLGLGIVSRIVGDHGGTFVLESTDTVGTTAKVASAVMEE